MAVYFLLKHKRNLVFRKKKHQNLFYQFSRKSSKNLLSRKRSNKFTEFFLLLKKDFFLNLSTALFIK